MRLIFYELKGNITSFSSNESVIMISKILSKVYEDSTSFDLSSNDISYLGTDFFGMVCDLRISTE